MAETTVVSPELQRLRLEQTAKSGAGWFYWIAGMSAANSLSWWFQMSWAFFIGLGITQIFDGLGSNFGTLGLILAVTLDIIVVALLVVVGKLALRYHAVYVVGMVFYALDGLLLLFFRDFAASGFHLFGLFFMVRGLRAARVLAAAPSGQDVLSASVPVTVHPTLVPMLREPRPAEEVVYFDGE